jgi:alpha-tubulin suppressor-like RCC1 family protein
VQPLKFPEEVEIVQLVHHPRSKHFLALSSRRKVYAWGSGDNGQLGLGEIK